MVPPGAQVRGRGVVDRARVRRRAAAAAFGGSLSSTFEAPASESQRAFDLLFERFPEQAGAGAEIVFRAEATVDDPAVSAACEALFAEVEGHRGVADVVSPLRARSVRSRSPADRTIAFARVRFADDVVGHPRPAPVEEMLSTAEDGEQRHGSRSRSAARRCSSPRPRRDGLA